MRIRKEITNNSHALCDYWRNTLLKMERAKPWENDNLGTDLELMMAPQMGKDYAIFEKAEDTSQYKIPKTKKTRKTCTIDQYMNKSMSMESYRYS